MKSWLIVAAVASLTSISGDPPDQGHPAPAAATPAAPKQPEPAKKADRPVLDVPPPLPPRIPSSPQSSAKDPVAAQRAEDALKQLKEGNERWATGSANHPNATAQRRQEVSDAGQKPFATILTCADSRLPVERIFDRGVGDIFVVRVAGNIAGDSEAATIEYGVDHLKTPLLVIMGHTKCGAVAAAATGAEVHGKVATLVASIRPAVERTARNNPRATPEDLARLSVKENVWQSIYDLLKGSDVCREKVASGQLRVIGAVCDISSGRVEWLGEHPWQSELLDALEARTAGTASKNEH